MNFKEELKKYKEKEKMRQEFAEFIKMSKEIDSRERTMNVCSYVNICPNTAEVIKQASKNTSFGLDITKDCVGGLDYHRRCGFFNNYERKLTGISSLIEGERVIRAGFYLPVKGGRE